ncbi:MAG: hypothetical protein ACWIPJ_07710 [Polaribacter sp.]
MSVSKYNDKSLELYRNILSENKNYGIEIQEAEKRWLKFLVLKKRLGNVDSRFKSFSGDG